MMRIIKIQEIAIAGRFENLGYLTLLIIRTDTNATNNNVKYMLYNPLKYNVATINEIPGMGNPIKSLVSMWSDITLYLVNLKTPQITINKLTSITSICIGIDVVLIEV